MSARRQNNKYITPDYRLESGNGPIPSGPKLNARPSGPKLGVDYVPIKRERIKRERTPKPPAERVYPTPPKMP